VHPADGGGDWESAAVRRPSKGAGADACEQRDGDADAPSADPAGS
jgi:hypothetical protein